MPKPPPTLPEVLDIVRAYCAANWIGLTPERLTVTFLYGAPAFEAPLVGIAARTAAEEESFVPNAFQEAILVALEGKALRTDALGQAVGDRSRLFKKTGGIQELRKEGLVSHHSRLGFYRPDAPPEELS